MNPEIPPKTTPWIRFDLYPPEAVLAGAQWRLTNETIWRQSGVYYTNVQEGNYAVEFKSVKGWLLPIFNPRLSIRPNGQIRMHAIYDKETDQPEKAITAHVVIGPAEVVEAGARWKLGVDTEWRDPRMIHTNLPAVSTYIEFKPVEGWKHPQNFPFTFRSGSGLSFGTSYSSIPPREFPNLIVIGASPLQAIAEGAQWKFLNESEWHEPYSYYTNWPVGAHEIEFKPLPGWLTPPNQFIVVSKDHDVCGFRGGGGYQLRPQCLITVNASHGKVAQITQQWPNWDGGEFERKTDWQNAKRILENSAYSPPFGKPGDKVRLIAVADPGYQFAGWSGDVSGLRNPAALVLDSDKNITAHFIPVSTTTLTATQSAESFFSPGTLMVHGQVNIPLGAKWDSLTWRPILPEGWTLSSVNGLGEPQLRTGSIVFTNLQFRNPALTSPNTTNFWELERFLPINPVQFTMVINVTEGQVGTKIIQSEITYAWKEGTNLVSGVTNAHPVEWVRQEPPLSYLTMDVSAGPPVLVIKGAPGISCTIQRREEDVRYPNWFDMAHFRLTNSTQTWIDTSDAALRRGYFYRAVLLQ